MMIFYVDDEGTRHEVDETTLNLIKDWIGFELIKLASYANSVKIPCQVAFTLFNLMVEETVAEMLGENEDEN